ncbi:Mothers against decapentaplegic-like 3 [Fragariocoptes setiger]|uniref:Mothers against decapentaplegic homolog n=1 Tax=Fragariocoptes setiger TaxID=1670756 RepID=A0ABQ7SAH8_9ACAR|nr:Mothers against decapentaplegic-like 3 [Fragariocoptes setiger]
MHVKLLNPHMTPIVKRLIGLRKERVNIDDKWHEKAVKGLARRLKKNLDSLEDLERAIISQDPYSPCVTIPRSLDGRLQVSQRKCLPHIVYCQIWRWPDITSHQQIRGIESCSYAFNLKSKYVCVNPYHYERTSGSSIPPVIVNRRNPVDISDRLSEIYGRFNGSMDPSEVADAYSSVHSAFTSPSSNPTPLGYMSEDGITEDSPMICQDSCEQKFEPMVFVDQDIANDEGILSVPFPEQEYWCSIIYYELSVRLGDKYNASDPCLIVDGFTDPASPGRFCLGRISNVNRQPVTEHIRQHIGNGIKIYHNGTEVTLECLSSSSVFVQSALSNKRYNWDPATVCKVPPGGSLVLFNYRDFSQMLNKAVEEGYETVFSLIRKCSIRLSFVKGWGADYRRRDILSTPCWIEIQLNGPLRWLDQVLSQIGPPLVPCSSMS